MQDPTTDSFRAWSIRLREGDREAYGAVFKATYTPLFRYAWRFTRDEDAAYDVLQETYMKLWQIHERIDPDRSLKALLFQMARNFALNHERYKRRHATDPIEYATDDPSLTETLDEHMETRDLEAKLKRWILDMPDRRREAFMLSRYEGLSHEEIAQIMGLTSKTVNNHIVLALQHLRQNLEVYQADFFLQ